MRPNVFFVGEALLHSVVMSFPEFRLFFLLRDGLLLHRAMLTCGLLKWFPVRFL
jgi:hypothetical protein